MKKAVHVLAWLTLGLVVVLCALNWAELVAPAPLNLIVVEAQLPLGLVVLGLGAVPLALFFVAYLQQQVSMLVETRRLLRDVHRAHELADKAEASRVEGLRQLLAQECRSLHERLDSLGALPAHDAAAAAESRRPALAAPWHLVR